MKYALVSLGLVGCVLPNVEFVENGTDSAIISGLDTSESDGEPANEPSMDSADEPAAEPSNEPANEASNEPSGEPSSEPEFDLALSDIRDNVSPTIGQSQSNMTGYHLIFDGNLSMTQTLSPQTEVEDFLDFNESWGFGLTFAPFNQDVKDYMFGQAYDASGSQTTEDFMSYELPMFSTAQRSVSVHFVNSTDAQTFDAGCDLAVTPIFVIRALTPEGELCESAEFPNHAQTGNGQVNTFCVVDEVDPDLQFPQIPEAVQLIFMSREVSTSNMELQILMNQEVVLNTSQLSFDYSQWITNLDTTCHDERSGDVVLDFGKGMVIPSQQTPMHIPHLHARVDNLIMIDPTVSFAAPNLLVDSGFWIENKEPSDTPTSIYRDENMLFADTVEDGFAWWHFDRPLSILGGFNTNELSLLRDDSIYGTSPLEFQLIEPETNLPIEGQSDLESHYRHATNKLWCVGGWTDTTYEFECP